MTRAPSRRGRRRAVTILAATAVVAALAAGLFTVPRLAGEPARFLPAATEPAAAGVVAVPWVSAMVARDGTTVTVYSGAGRCEELADAVAAVAVDGPSQVEIAVTARIVEAPYCDVTGMVMPLAVTLPAPLGERDLADATTGQRRPAFLERHLPALGADRRWSPAANMSWELDAEIWLASYDDPEGTTIFLSAWPVGSGRLGKRVGTVALGPYRGTIARWDFWTVSWEVGGVAYSLELLPGRGRGELTLDQFTQELALLTWS